MCTIYPCIPLLFSLFVLIVFLYFVYSFLKFVFLPLCHFLSLCLSRFLFLFLWHDQTGIHTCTCMPVCTHPHTHTCAHTPCHSWPCIFSFFKFIHYFFVKCFSFPLSLTLYISFSLRFLFPSPPVSVSFSIFPSFLSVTFSWIQYHLLCVNSSH